MNVQSKNCESCGRSFEFRKKWKKNWDSIKYCSDECRKNKNKYDYQEEILKLLNQRDLGKTICPSEVLPNDLKSNQIYMEHVRRSARLLVHASHIEITQKGQVVDPDNFIGPIRLRLKK